ncbi:hypothetical protein PN450_06845 [Dolichospermum lemmermannii CS-548]|uniref:hypothetical protein n=1 Tax=Dolichospermum lemmermannii TaxID=54295 RepID=UPI00232E3341|nr:hypothetical protein [Dolichospermum lemmermannii]MDB9436526.1 hypothetical protein [Dolichospermum lemmermannii CS-548]
MLVGAKHLEDNHRSLPKIVLQMLRPYSCQLSVAKDIFLSGSIKLTQKPSLTGSNGFC